MALTEISAVQDNFFCLLLEIRRGITLSEIYLYRLIRFIKMVHFYYSKAKIF